TGQPISAALSSSGASGTGASTPTTPNQWPPSHSTMSGDADPMPSRAAAREPSTTAGYWALAAFSQPPLASEAPTVPSRSVRPASTAMLPVSPDGMWSLRYTWALTTPVAVTEVTGPIRPIIPTASSGNDDWSPKSVLPGATRNRLVPS